MSDNLALPEAHGEPVEFRADGFVCRSVDSGVGVVWVHLAGELDLATAGRLQRMLARSGARAPLIVVDLRKLTFMDCAGARVLTSASIRAQCHGNRVVLVRAPRQVQRLLAITGADSVDFVELDEGEPAIQALLRLARADQEHDCA